MIPLFCSPLRQASGVFAVVALVVVIFSCGVERQTRDVEEKAPHFAELVLSAPRGSVLPLPVGPFEPRAQRMLKIIQRIERFREDTSVRGLVIRSATDALSRAEQQELAVELVKFRDAGKQIVLWAPSLGDVAYLLAAHADRIALAPSGVLDLTGITAEVMFYRDLLDKVGVDAEFVRAGNFKSAVEPYTRNDMSDEARDMTNRLLDDLYGQMLTTLQKGRGVSEERAKELIDGGPYSAREALAAGLIDDLRYADELDHYVTELAGENVQLVRQRKRTTQAPRGELFELLAIWRDLMGSQPSAPRSNAEKIALIHADGLIMPGRSDNPFQQDEFVTSGELVTALNDAAEDRTVKAIVMRVNSPGGSALASDLIWRAVGEARREKPVIVSMGDVAASGGYYIAMNADYIIADAATITGSIGVFGGKFDLSGLYEKIGVRKEVLKRGENATLFEETHGFTDSERERFGALIDAVYDDFVGKAADGRKKTREEVHAVAQGQVWTGREAMEHGLIDEIGGLKDAFRIAKLRAGYSAGEKLELLELPRPRSLLTSLLDEGRSSLRAEDALKRVLAEWLGAFNAIRQERVLTLLPYVVRVGAQSF